MDRSARPQTVGSDPRIAGYRRLLEIVFHRTGVPFVLNTSFNTKRSEPICESPAGAVSSFLEAAARGPANAVLYLEGRLLRARPCPVSADGAFPAAAASRPARRHAAWSARTTSGPAGDDPPVLTVADLDEALEDGARTGRGAFAFLDALEAEIYARCDGEATAEDLAEDLAGDALGEAVSDADVYGRLARLWRAGLVSLGP